MLNVDRLHELLKYEALFTKSEWKIVVPLVAQVLPQTDAELLRQTGIGEGQLNRALYSLRLHSVIRRDKGGWLCRPSQDWNLPLLQARYAAFPRHSD